MYACQRALTGNVLEEQSINRVNFEEEFLEEITNQINLGRKERKRENFLLK